MATFNSQTFNPQTFNVGAVAPPTAPSSNAYITQTLRPLLLEELSLALILITWRNRHGK